MIASVYLDSMKLQSINICWPVDLRERDDKLLDRKGRREKDFECLYGDT